MHALTCSSPSNFICIPIKVVMVNNKIRQCFHCVRNITGFYCKRQLTYAKIAENRSYLLQGGAMNTVQIKLEQEYHDKLLAFCTRNGVPKADAVRFMIDRLKLNEVSDVEFDRWYDTRRKG